MQRNKQQFTKEQQYIQARKRVEKIGKFYKHLIAYVIVNTFLSAVFIVGDINDGDTFNQAFFNLNNYKIWFFWGIGIVFQGLNTFGLNLVFSKGWQDRKVREFMNDK